MIATLYHRVTQGSRNSMPNLHPILPVLIWLWQMCRKRKTIKKVKVFTSKAVPWMTLWSCPPENDNIKRLTFILHFLFLKQQGLSSWTLQNSPNDGVGQRKPGRYGHSLLMAFPLTIARASLLRDSWKIRLQSPTKSSTSIYSIVLSSVFHSLSILRISRTIFVQHSPVHEWVGHHKNNSNISHLTGPTFNPLTSEL